MKYYKLDAATLEKELETDLERGLSASQVVDRFHECGYNTSYNKPSLSLKYVNLVFLILELFIPVVYLVFAVFNIKTTLDLVSYAVAAFVIILVSQVIFYVVKVLSDRGMYLSALNDPHFLTVVRDGEYKNIKYTEVLYGDIVILKKGDYIPFDGVIISSNALVTDETRIGGDDRASKHTGVISEDNVTPTRLFNTVFCGSYVVHGKAKVVVTDISSRVYLVKSGKNRMNKMNYSSKTVDVATIFSVIFSLFCIIFSVICGFISSDFSGLITSALLFTAIIVSGFIKVFADLIYKKTFLSLSSKSIYLKSFSDIEVLNNSDVLLVPHDMVFENKSEISGFITENMEYASVSSVGKSNFSTFLYASFCLDPNSSSFKSCCKILKKVGVDFLEINTMCPVFSRVDRKIAGIDICARAYDGNNMLIATGNINSICKICDCTLPVDVLTKLNHNSTEMIAVAIKNIDIVPNDLTSQTDGFTFAGVLGINRQISSDIIDKCKVLNKSGTHPIILFPGNESSLRSAVGEKARIVSLSNFDYSMDVDFCEIDYLCDYNGEYEPLVSALSKRGFLPSYFGDKALRDKKCIAFKSLGLTSYDTKDADVVVPERFDYVYSIFAESRNAVHLINNVFECFCLFASFYVICGVLFSLLFSDLLISTVSAAFVLLLVLPVAFFIKLYKGEISESNIHRNSIKESSDKHLSFVVISSGVFLIICVITKFLCSASVAAPFLLLTFITYLCSNVDRILKKIPCFALSLLLPFLLAVFLMTPAACILGYSSLGILPVIISLIVGVFAKLSAKFICRSVKI